MAMLWLVVPVWSSLVSVPYELLTMTGQVSAGKSGHFWSGLDVPFVFDAYIFHTSKLKTRSSMCDNALKP